MKIGILYICTGNYTIFWKDFYLSCEKNFINEHEKHYFVFTDKPEIEFENENINIHKIYQENLGWPFNTLKRYSIFLRNEEKIKKMDFIFYLNANVLFLKEITTEEFLPLNHYSLVGCLHPGFYNKSPNKYTYENRSASRAYLKNDVGKYYFAGGINGGKTKEFIECIKILNKNIEDDLNNQIIAKWHDESHWNHYLNNNLNKIKILSPAYLYPENSLLPFPKKILIRDKRSLGGHSKLRGKIKIRLVISQIKFLLLKILKKYNKQYEQK